MSQENVQLVRRLYDAVERGDAATVLSLYHPDVEWDFTRHPFGSLLGTAFYRGHDGLRSFFGELDEAWGSVQWEVRELIDAGEHVVLVIDQRARGRTSGADTEASAVGVWTVQGGRVTRVVWF